MSVRLLFPSKRNVVLLCLVILIYASCMLIENLGRRAVFPGKNLHLFEGLCCSFKNVSNFELPENTSGYLLVALVLTRPGAYERRQGIRNTWMRKYKNEVQGTVLFKFSIGTESASEEELRQLQREDNEHGDILFLNNVKESYTNLTRKVLFSFVHLHKYYQFSYILKCDDDSFIILDTILEVLRRRTSPRSYYWGRFLNDTPVLEKGKFAEPKWVLGKKYISYASGPGYILSGDLVRLIARNADELMLYHNEDVSVGVWISPYDIERQHDDRVCDSVRYYFYRCSKNAVVLHPVKSTKDFYKLQAIYQEVQRNC